LLPLFEQDAIARGPISAETSENKKGRHEVDLFYSLASPTGFEPVLPA
jgi:hypothetical protein